MRGMKDAIVGWSGRDYRRGILSRAAVLNIHWRRELTCLSGDGCEVDEADGWKFKGRVFR